ncbi:hypothetical protein LUZ60_013231 [Juncus effusus]|nr:hypothetical protein LUZ60_013231 [Juncus effusus]
MEYPLPRTPRRLRTTTTAPPQPDSSSAFPRTPLRRIQSTDEFPRTPLRSNNSTTNYFPATPRTPATRRRRQPPPPVQKKSASSGFPHRLVEFLNENYKTQDDLVKTKSLKSRINGECVDAEKKLNGLKGKLSLTCNNWVLRSEEFRRIVDQNPLSPPQSQGEDLERMVRVELPILAKEIEKIETLRLYAEKALQLEAMVGNLEDSAFSIIKQTSVKKSFSGLNRTTNLNDMQFKQEKLMNSINFMKEIEQELVQICTNRPKWSNLVKAVDSRLEKILSILRPQSFSDYRALLSALNWPPPLLTGQSQSQTESQPIPNPLLLMDSSENKIFTQSFLALCALQYVQSLREGRIGEKLRKYPSFENGLWAVDELVRPIASRMEYHFAKWSDEIEYIFALVYKVTKDFMQGVDDVLQPLIDKANLRGLSAKEAWVSSMVKVVLGFLEKQVFPDLVRKYYEKNDENLEIFASWLNLIDLMISFDKRMLVLSSNGIQKIEPILDLNEGLAKSLSIFSIFEENSNWLKIWAEIELVTAQDKIKPELEIERNWFHEIKKTQDKNEEVMSNNFLLSSREEYKAPLIVDFVMKIASLMIEKGRILPTKKLKIEFIKNSAALLLNHFFIILLERSKDLELITSSIDEYALVQISSCINSARYFEYIISEWDEDLTFLDLVLGEENEKRSFFADEILFLVKLETDCLEEIMSAILLEFEAFSYDYMQNIDQWEDFGLQTRNDFSDEELQDGIISEGLIEALEILRDRIVKLKDCLNSKDFFDIWRSVAEGLDYFIFSSIPWIDVRFSNFGVYQFRVDMLAVFRIFKPFCVKIEAFFPFLSECLKLLSLSKNDVDLFLKELITNEKRLKEWLKQKGLHHVSGSQAKMILVDRNFDETIRILILHKQFHFLCRLLSNLPLKHATKVSYYDTSSTTNIQPKPPERNNEQKPKPPKRNNEQKPKPSKRNNEQKPKPPEIRKKSTNLY